VYCTGVLSFAKRQWLNMIAAVEYLIR